MNPKKRLSGAALSLAALLALAACGGAEQSAGEPGAATPVVEEPVAEEPAAQARSAGEIIGELVADYGARGDASEERVRGLLGELNAADPSAAEAWTEILELWKAVNSELPIHYGVLPDGLADTDALCLVALGFQLNPDGTMREELIRRLQVVLASAEKYPNACIVCTGGATASGDRAATEAGRMAEWLIENGVEAGRVIVEDRSLTTAQNAAYTCALLAEAYPQVSQLAILSSDYHIATGALLFGAEAILRAGEGGSAQWTVVSNAACRVSSGSLSTMFQAGALMELAGDAEGAYRIYNGSYAIP